MKFSKTAFFICFLVAGKAQASCDPCLMAAANSAASAMQSAIMQVATAVQQNVQATQQLNQSIIQAGTNITAGIASQTAEQAITDQRNSSAIVSAIKMTDENLKNATTLLRKTITDGIDLTNGKIVQSLKAFGIQQQDNQIKYEFDLDYAQPISGRIGTNRAEPLQRGLAFNHALKDRIINDLREYNDGGFADAIGMGGSQTRYLESLPEETWDPSPMVGETIISEEDFLHMQKMIQVTVNPYPKAEITDLSSSGAIEAEINRRIKNGELLAIQQILVDQLMDIYPSIDAESFLDGYSSPEVINDKTSLMEVLRSEVDGRLGTEQWYKHMQNQNSAGLQRELIYMQPVKLKILSEILEAEDHALMLDSIRLGRGIE